MHGNESRNFSYCAVRAIVSVAKNCGGPDGLTMRQVQEEQFAKADGSLAGTGNTKANRPASLPQESAKTPFRACSSVGAEKGDGFQEGIKP